MQRLKTYFMSHVSSCLMKEFNYSNINQVPKLKKIVVSRGFDETCQVTKILNSLLEELSNITGQRPVVVRSKVSISNFKVKENMPIGMTVTLRNEKMYAFLDRLINLVLPRIKDFQGVSQKSFVNGSFSFGLNDLFMFPEVEFDKVLKVKGLNIVLITSASTSQEAFLLLKSLGFPFKN